MSAPRPRPRRAGGTVYQSRWALATADSVAAAPPMLGLIRPYVVADRPAASPEPSTWPNLGEAGRFIA